MNDVRALFFSDLHLGFRHTRMEALLESVSAVTPRFLYLAGDTFDAKRLHRNWSWPESCHRFVEWVLACVDAGTRVLVMPGNHDGFLRGSWPAIRGIEVAEEFVHEGADGARWLVLHGDVLDPDPGVLQPVSGMAGRAYDGLIAANRATDRVLSWLGLGSVNYSAAVKRLSKQVLGVSSVLPDRVAQRARHQGLDGVIFGHLHQPFHRKLEQITIYNCGDWIEHQSFLRERADGSMELVDRGVLIASSRTHVIAKE